LGQVVSCRSPEQPELFKRICIKIDDLRPVKKQPQRSRCG